MDKNRAVPIHLAKMVVCNAPILEPTFCDIWLAIAMDTVDARKHVCTFLGDNFKLSRKKIGKYRMDIPAASTPSKSADEMRIGTSHVGFDDSSIFVSPSW